MLVTILAGLAISLSSQMGRQQGAAWLLGWFDLLFVLRYWQDIERSKRVVEEVRLFIQSVNEEPRLEWFDKFIS